MDNSSGKRRFDEEIGLWVDEGSIPLVCLELSKSWTRIGVWFNSDEAEEWVDVENLIVETGKVARYDERLFVTSASWLSEYHHLLDVRALSRKMSEVDAMTSATLGAMFAMARQNLTAPTPLDAAISYCRPRPLDEPLYWLAHKYPMLLKRMKKRALPLFSQWGFWHDDAKLKARAIRPISWTIGNAPEIRIRALLGPGLDSQIVTELAQREGRVADLVSVTGASYAAVHAGMARLLGRGLLSRDDKKVWRVSEAGCKYLGLIF